MTEGQVRSEPLLINARRCRRLLVTAELLAVMLKGAPAYHTNAPKDLKIIDATFDPMRLVITLRVHSWEFDVVEPGDEEPILALDFVEGEAV